MKLNNIHKTLIIVVIFSLIAVMLYTTFAYLITTTNNTNTIKGDLGLDAYIIYEDGTDVLEGLITPGADYTSGINCTISLYKNTTGNTYPIIGRVYLTIDTIGENLKTDQALKWTIISDGEVLGTGNFYNKVAGKSITLKDGIELRTTQQEFTVYIWLDEALVSNYDIEGESFSVTVKAEATTAS